MIPSEDVICHGYAGALSWGDRKPSSRVGITKVIKNNLTAFLEVNHLLLVVLLHRFCSLGELSASDRVALIQASFSEILFK